MAVHPILEHLESLLPLTVLDEYTAFCHLGVNKHHEELIANVSVNSDTRIITISYILSTRRAVDIPRVELYLKALLSHDESPFSSIYIRDRRIIVGCVEHSKEDFSDFEEYDSVAECLMEYIHGYFTFFRTVCLIVRLCTRLTERGGTVQYRRLLPTRLAALTICGLAETDTCH